MPIPLVTAGIWILIVFTPTCPEIYVTSKIYNPSFTSERLCKSHANCLRIVSPNLRFKCVEIRGA